MDFSDSRTLRSARLIRDKSIGRRLAGAVLSLATLKVFKLSLDASSYIGHAIHGVATTQLVSSIHILSVTERLNRFCSQIFAEKDIGAVKGRDVNLLSHHSVDIPLFYFS